VVLSEKLEGIRVKLGCVFSPFFDGFIDANGGGVNAGWDFSFLEVEMEHMDEVIISLSRK